jgi:lipoate-protein ligase A
MYSFTNKDKLKTGDDGFATKIKLAVDEAIEYFDEKIKKSKLQDTDWTHEEFRDSLLKDIEELCIQQRTEALTRVSKAVEVLKTN